MSDSLLDDAVTPPDDAPITDPVAQAARITTISRWIIGFNVLGTIAYSVLAFSSQSPTIIALLGLSVLIFVPLMSVYRAAQRQQSFVAITILNITAFVVCICGMLIVPDAEAVWLLATITPLVVSAPYLGKRALRMTLMVTPIIGLIVVALGIMAQTTGPWRVRIFEPIAESTATTLKLSIIPGIYLTILLPLWYFHSRLYDSVRRLQTTNGNLRAAQAKLEQRTQSLSTVLTEVQIQATEQAILLAEIDQQRETIQALSIPVLPLSEQTIVVPLIGALDSERLHLLEERSLHMIERLHARQILIDITGVPNLDRDHAQKLLAILDAAQQRGATVLLIGTRPEIAQILGGLRFNLKGIQTFPDIQTALQRVSV